MLVRDSADRVFVQVDAESLRNLLCDTRAATAGITAFEFEDGLNDFQTWAFRFWFTPRLGREEIPAFLAHKSGVDSEEGGLANADGGPLDSARLEKMRPEGQEESLNWR